MEIIFLRHEFIDSVIKAWLVNCWREVENEPLAQVNGNAFAVPINRDLYLVRIWDDGGLRPHTYYLLASSNERALAQDRAQAKARVISLPNKLPN